MKRILFLLPFIIGLCMNADAQRQFRSKCIIDGYYTISLSKMLDTISAQCQCRIIYDKEMIKDYSVVDHYFAERIKDVLDKLCKDNNLRYWVENDNTVYIIHIPEDVERLKKMTAGKNEIAPYTPEKYTDNVPVRISQPTITKTVTSAGAEKPFNLTGKITDQLTGESLPSAIVHVRNSNISTTTNPDGYFTLLHVPNDTCVLEINFIGYQPEIFPLDAENIKNPLQIGLFSSVRALKEVKITDKATEAVMNIDKRKVSVLQISPAKLEELPNIGEKDILRSFQLMPGVSGSNESSSGAYVRGGTPDQNLVLFDGFTVYQVDHLYGFFSAFNSNAVKDVTLYKGGFSAKFGGRLSSVTDIVGKEGNSKEFNIGGDLSLLSANIYAEKPLGNQSTILVAYRQSYQGPLYNEIFNKFNNSSSSSGSANGGGFGNGGGPPTGGGGRFGGGGGPTVTTPASYFYDLNAKYTYAPDTKNKLSWSIYKGDDNLDNSKIITLPSFLASGGGNLSNTDKTTYGNLGSSLKWSSHWNSRLYSNSLLSYSTYHSDRDNSTSINITDISGVAHVINNGTFDNNKLQDLSFKSDWELQLTDKTKFLFGGFSSKQKIDYVYSENDTSTLISQHNEAITAGMYAEFESNLTDKLQIRPGLRGTYFDQTGKFYLEPRFSATYALTDHFTLKSAFGKFNQFTDKVVREDILSGSSDFWVLSNKTNIPVSSALHYIAGFSYEKDNYLIDIEGYYKTLNGLSQYSERETGNSRQGTVTLEDHFYTGTGFTRGIEVLIQKTRGNYTGWVSYTLGEAINHFDVYGGDFPSNQDIRHELKSVNLYHYHRWTFSSTWIFATGKPYTAPLTSYTIKDYAGIAHDLITISAENGQRLPAYHRLDAAVTYDILKVDSRKTGSIGLSFFNVYNRANLWYKQYNIISNQVITNDVDYLGFTPNLTLTLKWK